MQYSAYLDITWKWPIALYRREYKSAKWTDGNYLIKEGDNKARCSTEECKSNFYITYGKQYFAIINWDTVNTIEVPFETVDFAPESARLI
jgi:hypothetical protein